MIKNLELGKFYRIKCKRLEDSPVRHYNMIVVEDTDGEPRELLFSDSDLERATLRRILYQKDIPKYSISANSKSLCKLLIVITIIMTALLTLLACNTYF